MDDATWSDVYSAEQLAAALDVHAVKIAKMHGVYSMAADISHAAECIRDLSERLSNGEAIALRLSAKIDETNRRVRASLESLGKEPQ